MAMLSREEFKQRLLGEVLKGTHEAEEMTEIELNEFYADYLAFCDMSGKGFDDWVQSYAD